MRSVSYDKAIKVTENWKMTDHINVTYVKNPNLIDPLVNITKNATNLLIFDKKNNLKPRKSVRKRDHSNHKIRYGYTKPFFYYHPIQ